MYIESEAALLFRSFLIFPACNHAVHRQLDKQHEPAQIYDYGRSVYYGVNNPYYMANVRLDNLAIIMTIGYQHDYMNVLSIDLNVGAKYYCISTDSREVLSVSPIYDDVAVGDKLHIKDPRWQIAGRFTIGYYIRYDWMKRKK